MPDDARGSAAGTPSLPDKPDLDRLRKRARRVLAALRSTNPAAKLAAAQLSVARSYGFPSWRALETHVESLSIEGHLFSAARRCHVGRLAALLDADAGRLQAREAPCRWSLLHAAAHTGCTAAVDLLLARGLDPNTREKGDDTSAMHWTAAAAHQDVVRRLADAGGDVVGRGDHHELEVMARRTSWRRGTMRPPCGGSWSTARTPPRAGLRAHAAGAHAPRPVPH